LSIKKILVSQPRPKTDKSPYFDLAEKYNVAIDFKPFIQVEGVAVKEFRRCRINVLDYSAIILTSRTAIDHFFRICEEMRVNMPDTMKYFCINEATAYYLQKYIVYRKRKIFYGKGDYNTLIDIVKKHNEDNYLIPQSENHKEIPRLLKKNKIKFKKILIYQTLSSDLSEITKIDYDVLVFFSPSGVKSLKENFPNFVQNSTKIACFGPKTAKAVKDAGLRLDIKAPTSQAPSMTMALEQFINNNNGSNPDKG